MKKKILKSLIFDACLQNQKEKIENIKNRLNDLKNEAINGDQIASQTENRSAGKVDLMAALGKEIMFAQTEMEILKSLDASKENATVESGAVVITDKLTFFISISGDKIELEGEEIYCISTKAPIYSFMKNLEMGNTFSYNETSYQIIKVY